MIINGEELLMYRPIENMETSKLKHEPSGTSYGLVEAGYDIRIAQDITLHPFKRFTLASTMERFDMPETLVGGVCDKSTNIRRGLMVGNSIIEPGWKGWLTLELFYFGWKPFRITAGTGIAQVLFNEIAVPASYGNGKYQNQEYGPQEAR